MRSCLSTHLDLRSAAPDRADYHTPKDTENSHNEGLFGPSARTWRNTRRVVWTHNESEDHSDPGAYCRAVERALRT